MNMNAPFYVSEVNTHIIAYFPTQAKREICKYQISRYIICRKFSAKFANVKSGAPYPPAAGRVPPAIRHSLVPYRMPDNESAAASFPFLIRSLTERPITYFNRRRKAGAL